MHAITILGANGTKGFEGGTSAFLIDAHNVIDAGNLLRPLKASVAEIETVWLTHSHLDHIVDIAYVLDSYFETRKKPLRLRGLPATLNAIKQHYLNDVIWPDFSKIRLQASGEMALTYEPVTVGESYALDSESSIEPFATDHTVESCGYMITRAKSSLLITADTHSLNAVLELVAKNEAISALVIECSFPSEMRALAEETKHLTPELLFGALKPLEKSGIKLYINHIKPLYKESIEREIDRLKGSWQVEILKDGKKIHF